MLDFNKNVGGVPMEEIDVKFDRAFKTMVFRNGLLEFEIPMSMIRTLVKDTLEPMLKKNEDT